MCESEVNNFKIKLEETDEATKKYMEVESGMLANDEYDNDLCGAMNPESLQPQPINHSYVLRLDMYGRHRLCLLPV